MNNVMYFVDMPDIGGVLRLAVDWVLYPWQNWTFNLLGVFHAPAYWLIVGCFILGLVIHVILWLAGDPKAVIFSIIGGKSK